MWCDIGIFSAQCVTDIGLSHVTRLDDNLLPRAKALRDFTATDSQNLSFKVYIMKTCLLLLSSCMRVEDTAICYRAHNVGTSHMRLTAICYTAHNVGTSHMRLCCGTCVVFLHVHVLFGLICCVHILCIYTLQYSYCVCVSIYPWHVWDECHCTSSVVALFVAVWWCQ